jgi:hypothetical protein
MKNEVRLGLALMAAVAMTGCLEPSREAQRDTAANTRCSRLEECGEIGSGERYTDFDDCVVEVRASFNDLWPADECADGRINEELFDGCLQDLRTSDCNENFFDQLEFLGDCNADAICTDPPN